MRVKKIKLISVGRGKITRTINVTSDSFSKRELEMFITLESRKHLASQCISADYNERTKTGIISAGFHTVGKFIVIN